MPHKKEIYIEEINYNIEALNNFINKHSSSKYLTSYPTVYIVNHQKDKKYSVYVGETADIKTRTIQHLTRDIYNRDEWLYFSEADETKMYVIGHEYFNKSLTLDIENRLMLYLSSVDSIEHVYNRRTNPQNDYYTSEYLDDIFF